MSLGGVVIPHGVRGPSLLGEFGEAEKLGLDSTSLVLVTRPSRGS